MSEEPESLVLQLLRGIRDDVAKVDRRVDQLRGEIGSLRADVASDFATMQKETREQIVGLRRAVVEYHSSVVGHGLLISEHEERLRRIKQTLNLPPLRAI
jgi:hypothetical protein